ncbi:MAG: 3D domain-containing protein [Candidatus Staskawiczbacteria bacterium]|nr:3D domain-containing protein [Candidatus Staskawiczbacteria bacterium]
MIFRIILIKKLFVVLAIAGMISLAVLLGLFIPGPAKAEPFFGSLLEKAAAFNSFCKLYNTNHEVKKRVKMIVTGYSSRVEETDDTPFITASGKNVAEGIIANNMLPFGSKIRIPELYGDRIFIVEDRMHQRKGNYHVDIWFSEYSEAKEFGAKITYVEILKN